VINYADPYYKTYAKKRSGSIEYTFGSFFDRYRNKPAKQKKINKQNRLSLIR
jgi:hypothetical protein